MKKFLIILLTILVQIFLACAHHAVNNKIFYTAASYEISIKDYPKNVKRNIEVAIKRCNNVIIKKDDFFSFNMVIGPRIEVYGYQKAQVYGNYGESSFDVGGGICIVSSLLYNAAIYAGLHIIERHQHVRMISYVPLGHDATVNYSYKDLIFQNNLYSAIILNTFYSDNIIKINILSEESAPFKTAIHTEVKGTSQAAFNALISTKKRARGIESLKVQAYRTFYSIIDNKEIGTEILSIDYY